MSTTSEYWVGPVIGEGAFGQVLYGKHKGTGRAVALKVMEQVVLKKQPHVLPSVLTERRLLQLFQESNYVVNLWASFYDSQCVYLVLELAQGGDLQGFIELGLLWNDNDDNSSSNTKDRWHRSIPYYAWQLTQAIEFLHSKRVIHCDLKPANLLLCSTTSSTSATNGSTSTEGYRLQLADFASALELDTLQLFAVPRGTTDYSPPELLKAQSDLTVAVDYWSLGCILYAMFQQQSPFHNTTDTDAASEAWTVQRILDHAAGDDDEDDNNDHEDASLDWQGVPKEWRSTIQGLLQADPAKRTAAWKMLVQSTTLLQAEPPSDVLLPQPVWAQEVEEQATELKDGALGWGVFLL
jgi:serine/threonine protein kinase